MSASLICLLTKSAYSSFEKSLFILAGTREENRVYFSIGVGAPRSPFQVLFLERRRNCPRPSASAHDLAPKTEAARWYRTGPPETRAGKPEPWIQFSTVRIMRPAGPPPAGRAVTLRTSKRPIHSSGHGASELRSTLRPGSHRTDFSRDSRR